MVWQVIHPSICCGEDILWMSCKQVLGCGSPLLSLFHSEGSSSVSASASGERDGLGEGEWGFPVSAAPQVWYHLAALH